MTLESPIPLASFDQSVQPVNTARSLPPDAYTSDAFYEFERKAIFGREWFCVGREDQIPDPGDYFTVTMAGEPLVVVRGTDAAISVLSAVCQHRGALVAKGSGSCGSYLRCPYHWWTYDLDGKLVTAPQMHKAEDFDKALHGLPGLRVDRWNGFVFACLHADTEPISSRLGEFGDYVENYQMGDLRTTEPVTTVGHPFNWKLMVENGIEPYHASYLHHDMFEFPKERNYTTTAFESDAAIVSVVNHGFVDASLNPTYRPYFPVIETLSDEDRRRFGFAAVPPNLMLGWQSDLIFWFLILPTSPHTVDLQWGYLLPQSSHDLQMFEHLLELSHAGVEDYNSQDLPIAEDMQVGLSSQFAPQGRYSHEEEVLARFNRWLLARYRPVE